MPEMALTADRLVVIGRGRLIADTTVEEFTLRASRGQVLVRCADPARLAAALVAAGASVTDDPQGMLLVGGLEAGEIGRIAHDRDVVLHELTPQRASLEEAFMELTAGAVDYQGRPPLESAALAPAGATLATNHTSATNHAAASNLTTER